MKMKKSIQILLFSIFALFFIFLESCEPKEECNDDDADTSMIVRKPNIYLYPVEDTELNIFIQFPQGGYIITSVPEYNEGWSVFIDTEGFIDYTYEFLFYESIQPDVWQYECGWIIERKQLEKFFRENMALYGFAGKEINDFIDYWIPLLSDHDHYKIYPQHQEIIEQVITIETSVEPDNVLRLFYVIEGCNDTGESISSPNAPALFTREGFYMAEWGVILK